MKKKLFLLFTLLTIQSYLKIIAQNKVLELPTVGDTIDHEEKIKFVLFEEIPNKDYYFSIISENNSDTLLTHYKKNDTLQKKIHLKELSLIQTNISKLNAYYISVEENKVNTTKDYSLISNPNTNLPQNDKRADSLLATNPQDYKAIQKEQNKKLKKKNRDSGQTRDLQPDKEKNIIRAGEQYNRR